MVVLKCELLVVVGVVVFDFNAGVALQGVVGQGFGSAGGGDLPGGVPLVPLGSMPARSMTLASLPRGSSSKFNGAQAGLSHQRPWLQLRTISTLPPSTLTLSSVWLSWYSPLIQLIRGSLVPATGEKPSVVLGTTGPMPVRDWAGAAAGSSKAAVRRTVHRRRHRRERGEGAVHVGCGSWGWVGAMPLPCSGARI